MWRENEEPIGEQFATHEFASNYFPRESVPLVRLDTRCLSGNLTVSKMPTHHLLRR